MRFWFSAGISKWTTGFIFIFLPPDIFLINELWWVEAAVVGPASCASCECIIASRLAAKQGFVTAGRNTVLAWTRRENVVRGADAHNATGASASSVCSPERRHRGRLHHAGPPHIR